MSKARFLVLAASFACLCTAQQSPLFPGTSLPIEKPPRDLADGYFPMKIKEQSSGALGDYYSSYAFQIFGRFGSGNSESQSALNRLFELLPISWTKNETVSLYGETFLVTYIWEPSVDEIGEFTNGKPFKPVQLKLKLIKSNQIGTIEPFPGLTRESYLAALDEFQQPGGGRKTTPAGAQTESLSRIKQCALAVIMYASDYDDVLPYVQSSKTLHNVTEPYIKNREMSQTLNPNKPGMFHFNISIGGANMSQIVEPANTPMLFDPTPWPDGRYIVAYADGHAKIESPEQWKSKQGLLKLKLKRKGKPLPP